MDSSDLRVLLLQALKALCEWVGNFEAVVPIGDVSARPRVLKRSFHLANDRDHLLGFGDEVLLLSRYLAHMVVEGFRQSREELRVWVRRLAVWNHVSVRLAANVVTGNESGNLEHAEASIWRFCG